MFWETLWALILGFTLSGAVQAFVSKERMRAKLGDHRPGGRRPGLGLRHGVVLVLVRGVGHGQVAVRQGGRLPSCHGLHGRLHQSGGGAGVVMLVLMGWQFAAAEFVGGPIMIVLLALPVASSSPRPAA